MAEILLSLTIIGVVAAITLPSLTGNINERTWNTQRKALYARMSQAIALMPSLNGYGTLDDTTDTAAETFVTAGLSKVLKINNICDNEHIEDCGIPLKIVQLDAGSTLDVPAITTLQTFNDRFTSSNGFPVDIKAAAFETANGESILVYYNPNCVSNMQETAKYNIQNKMCVNMIYDLNSSKGPNTVGKDIGFISIFYPTDSMVAAPVVTQSKIEGGVSSQSTAGRACQNLDSESRMVNLEELGALFINRQLLGRLTVSYSWSSLLYDVDNAWLIDFSNGETFTKSRGNSHSIWCVKR